MAVGDLARFGAELLRLRVVGVASGDQRLRPLAAAGLSKPKRTGDPFVDELACGDPFPHACARRGLECELAVELGARLGVLRQLETVLHRGPERLAIESQRLGVTNFAP